VRGRGRFRQELKQGGERGDPQERGIHLAAEGYRFLGRAAVEVHAVPAGVDGSVDIDAHGVADVQ
jgi:hypothetical protein